MERGKKKALPSQRSHDRYKDIESMIRPSMPSYERWLGIERVDKFPKDISAVLSQAQFLSLRDEKIIVQLSDLGIGNMGELRECWIEGSQAMKLVFDIGAHDLAQCQPVLRRLEKLRISKLMKLTNICIGSGILKEGSFGSLKHLQLEYCPQVVTIFSSAVRLESLEVLEIKFCARLEEIFAAKVNAEGSLGRLHTLCLLELPTLKNIAHNLQLASLKMAHVKGCPELRKLPLHSNTGFINCNKIASSLEVTGESKWWEQLEWEDENVKRHISFNSWKPFRLPKQS
ncbi:hypothetical protein IFM89_025748 [Coptis chinensis]|uniref:Disease resistance protein At4g27190-like leucine-rich repeats domain-containing protein n=1 Tax=Coptis chinensis TaxID=261450 RepID=A0A835I6L9_9MAGN|nr:hypothetical protein IFM89_025748 [Coptis chinensis]